MNGCRPCIACVSDPQTPATTTRTSASFGPGTGVSTVTTRTPSSPTTTRRIVAGTASTLMNATLARLS
jgi:hypothetical protein